MSIVERVRDRLATGKIGGGIERNPPDFDWKRYPLLCLPLRIKVPIIDGSPQEKNAAWLELHEFMHKHKFDSGRHNRVVDDLVQMRKIGGFDAGKRYYPDFEGNYPDEDRFD